MNDTLVTGAFVAFLVAAIPLAALTTKAVDFLRGLLDKDHSWPGWVLNVGAFVVGVALCVGWQFNLVSALAHAVPALASSTRLDGVAGQILTGLAVGGMAGFWHDRVTPPGPTA